MEFVCTRKTESRAAMATMSAHETVSGHISSSCCLILSMTLNPRAEFKLGVAVFSPTKPGLSSSRLEPSHPCCFP